MRKRHFVTPTLEVVKIKGVSLMAGTVNNTDNNADLVIGGGSSGGARSEKFFGYTWDDDYVGQEDF